MRRDRISFSLGPPSAIIETAPELLDYEPVHKCFSLGPPSAIIETRQMIAAVTGLLGFSLGPPSAIIETLPQTVDLAEYFNNLVCRIFELSCFAQKTL